MREGREVRDKEMQEGKEVHMERKGRWMEEVRWRKDLSGRAQEDFGRESAGQNIWKVRKIEGSAGEKGSTGMQSKTQSKEQSLAGK